VQVFNDLEKLKPSLQDSEGCALEASAFQIPYVALRSTN